MITKKYSKLYAKKKYRQFKKRWTDVTIISLILTSAIVSGIYLGHISSKSEPLKYEVPNVSAPRYDHFMGLESDTVDTELSTNTDWGYMFPSSAQGIEFKFSGRAINESVTVQGFQCKLDESGVWFPCAEDFSPIHQPRGDHTIEVRAMDNFGNPDHTPSVWMWSVK